MEYVSSPFTEVTEDMLSLPWRSFPTGAQANTLQVLCGVKCNPSPASCGFSCTSAFSDFCKRGHISKTSHTSRPLHACRRQSKEETLAIRDVCDGRTISESCTGENLQASICGSASVLLGKRASIACILAALVTSGCPDFNQLPPLLQNSLGLGVAHASLVQMPPEFLNNRYYLVRAGESEFERIGVINTNPVTKTNVESGLSENGRKQTVKAARLLREMGACDGSCWIWPSITQRAYQAAEIIAYVNNINRSRIVPEYSFLDARGLGAYEGKSLNLLSKIYELDAESTSLRPPPYTDGTPNESVADVFVRVTQLMSVLETQYFGESIIIVAPDSDNLSILQAALTGLDLRRHSELAFPPGEVRYVDLDDRPPQPQTRRSGLVNCRTPSQCG